MSKSQFFSCFMQHSNFSLIGIFTSTELDLLLMFVFLFPPQIHSTNEGIRQLS